MGPVDEKADKAGKAEKAEKVEKASVEEGGAVLVPVTFPSGVTYQAVVRQFIGIGTMNVKTARGEVKAESTDIIMTFEDDPDDPENQDNLDDIRAGKTTVVFPLDFFVALFPSAGIPAGEVRTFPFGPVSREVPDDQGALNQAILSKVFPPEADNSLPSRRPAQPPARPAQPKQDFGHRV
jgi:hypothetical protein